MTHNTSDNPQPPLRRFCFWLIKHSFFGLAHPLLPASVANYRNEADFVRQRSEQSGGKEIGFPVSAEKSKTKGAYQMCFSAPASFIAGTALSVIGVADAVLMKSDPFDVIGAIILSRATRRKMRQNLWWAAGYNVIAFPLAAGLLYPSIGLLLSPEIAAFSMSGSTLVVVVNALLLKRVKMNESAPTADTKQDNAVKTTEGDK